MLELMGKSSTLANKILGFVLLVTVFVMEAKISLEQCPLVARSSTGYALLGKEYKSFPTAGLAACMFKCDEDKRCMSSNFYLDTKTCDLNTQTKESEPTSYKERPNSIYSSNMELRTPGSLKGSKELPAKSCLDIKVSGGSRGTGAYWIDPANTGNATKAYCDMTTDGGGWTIVTRTILQSTALPNKTAFGTYDVIASYSQNDIYIIPKGPAMLDILQKMGFHQIHFYCRKDSVGRVVSIMTKNNTAGQAVVRFFTDDEFAEKNLPDACGSFDRLPEDMSILAKNCDKWGKLASGTTEVDKWGYKYGSPGRIGTRPFAIDGSSKYGFGCSFGQQASVRCYCDDNFNTPLPYNVNDTWQISVR